MKVKDYAVSASHGESYHYVLKSDCESVEEATDVAEVHAARLHRNWKRSGGRGPKPQIHVWQRISSRAAQTLKDDPSISVLLQGDKET